MRQQADPDGLKFRHWVAGSDGLSDRVSIRCEIGWIPIHNNDKYLTENSKGFTFFIFEKLSFSNIKKWLPDFRIGSKGKTGEASMYSNA